MATMYCKYFATKDTARENGLFGNVKICNDQTIKYLRGDENRGRLVKLPIKGFDSVGGRYVAAAPVICFGHHGVKPEWIKKLNYILKNGKEIATDCRETSPKTIGRDRNDERYGIFNEYRYVRLRRRRMQMILCA